ncbi:MAG TPA: putative lipid II flippase FtsW [Chloroflexota bacterium]|nr:putative lipid II flippase FtsW [Chloroflexota bacterium]
MTESPRRPPDLWLLVAVLLLLVAGIVWVYSSSFIVAHNEFGDDNYFLTRHLIALAGGLVLMGFLAGVDYRRWRRWALMGMVVSVGLLVVVLIPGLGVEVYGSRRWLQTGGLLPGAQPSELAKIAVIVFIASWLASGRERASGLKSGSLPFLGLVGLVAFLIMREPDMGTTIVLVLAAATVFWVAGANVVHVAGAAGVGVAAMAWLVTSAAYRAQRLQGWADPWSDPLGAGWHTKQALTALGSGGLVGRGLGASLAKAYYLPSAHTDAIFAVIGEELGLLGTGLVLLLFVCIAWRGLVIAHRAPDRFGRLLAVGTTALIVWQALLNMMVVTNAVPFTGVTLPFVSFGGSSLVISLAAIGLLLGVSRATPRPEPAELRPAVPRRAERPLLGTPRRRPAAARPARPALASRPLSSVSRSGARARYADRG